MTTFPARAASHHAILDPRSEQLHLAIAILDNAHLYEVMNANPLELLLYKGKTLI